MKRGVFIRDCARIVVAGCTLATVALLPACSQNGYDSFDSGGPLIPEQAAFDVTYYDLDLVVDPSRRRIDGSLEMRARVVNPSRRIVLDLEDSFDIEAVTDLEGEALTYSLTRGRIWIEPRGADAPGSAFGVRVRYGGVPHVAENPPWDGGFTWAETPAGVDWISTTCQGEGADIWWPVKDHPGDEPDSMRMHFTVPNPLVVASNGRLESTEERGDSTRFNWFVSTPINTYNVTLNAADFRVLRTRHVSPTGASYPVEFYVLPKNVARGGAFLSEINDHLSFYEELLGPYPFAQDKYGVVQTPHLGMEHQTLIAYGADFDNGAMTGGTDWGFDALHHHELSHEWWGNMLTNADWSDMWLHEGFGTYMQALYAEREGGSELYRAYMDDMRQWVDDTFTLAPGVAMMADEIYDGQLYYKGAWVLHTLRYVVGDVAFFRTLREMAYPSRRDSTAAANTDASCSCRFVSTPEFIAVAESVSGKDLDWFFDVYLRQAVLPRLIEERDGASVVARWDVPAGLPFMMPLQFSRGDEVVLLVPDRNGVVEMSGSEWEIDARHWILRK